MWSILFSHKEKWMNTKKPNKVLAPLVIAGITIGFFTAAYRFIFVKSKQDEQSEQELEKKIPETDEFNWEVNPAQSLEIEFYF